MLNLWLWLCFQLGLAFLRHLSALTCVPTGSFLRHSAHRGEESSCFFVTSVVTVLSSVHHTHPLNTFTSLSMSHLGRLKRKLLEEISLSSYPSLAFFTLPFPSPPLFLLSPLFLSIFHSPSISVSSFPSFFLSSKSLLPPPPIHSIPFPFGGQVLLCSQAGLRLPVFLCQPLWCWDPRHITLCLADCLFLASMFPRAFHVATLH